MRWCVLTTALLTWIGIPTIAYAQASIAGVVRDTSGAVLPGVIVEGSSTVLIEKVRSVVTDGTGQYRIEDLRSGTYTVTFTLPGFSTTKREGIELTGSFTATVNAELRVGAVEETITVRGETPTVDLRNARTQQTINKDVISTLPTGGRTYTAVAFLVPGVNVLSVDVGGVAPITAQPTLTAHGSRTGEGRVQMDGFGIGSPTIRGGAAQSQYITNVVNTEETVVSTSGVSGEAENGGLELNLIPREGGNTIRGSFLVAGAGGAMQGSNYTQALKDQGLSAPNRLQRLWDAHGLFGGPIRKDRVWFLLTTSYRSNRNYIEGMYYNKNAHNPALWTYAPDLSRQALDDLTYRTASLRLTWQATPRNKFNVFRDEQYSCTSCAFGGRPTVSPESVVDLFGRPRLQQVTWTSPVTNRFLLDAGVSSFALRWGSTGPGEKDANLIQVSEQGGAIPGLIYRGYTADFGRRWNYVGIWRASASYITGVHSFKVGYIGRLSDTEDEPSSTFDLTYRFNNGVPNRLTMAALPFNVISRRTPFALYAQEQGTLNKLTLQGAVRYDHSATSFPDQQLGPARFIPVPIRFPAQDGVKFSDLSPRMGAVYDLFGNGKTAVKVSLSRYVEVQDATGIGTDVNPLVRLSTATAASAAVVTTNRSWVDANRDYEPNCDLLNPAANGECGPWDNQNFGKNVFSTAYDPAITHGWGVLPYNWFFNASVEHEIFPRVSGSVGYFRRSYGNLTVTDNLAVGPSDYAPFTVTAPTDPRLPGGGGYTINDLYDINPAKFGQVNNLVTADSHFGGKLIQQWNGVDVSVRARLRDGLTFQGSLSTGRTRTDNCDVVPKIDNPSRLYCNVETPFLTSITGFGSYTIPRWDVQVSGTFLSVPGPQLAANYNVPNALVAPSLGRNLAGGAANVLVNLVEPGTLYGDRRNQVDVRVAKILRFGRTRTQLGVDLYNVFNSSFVPTYNLTYGARWLTPTSLLPARFAEISARVDF